MKTAIIKSFKRWSPIHPLLMALFPVLSLYASNVDQIPFSNVVRSLVLAGVLAGLVVLLSWVLLRRWDKSVALASILLAIFFIYGHVYMFLKPASIWGFALGRHRFLIPVSLLLAALAWWRLRRAENVKRLNLILAAMTLAAILPPIVTILSYQASQTASSLAPPEWIDQESMVSTEMDQSELPDIYYIILDSYARSDILSEYYDYDNSDLINFLEDRGFYVAHQSRSNYVNSISSLTSSLNMQYLDVLIPNFMDSEHPQVPDKYLRMSKVRYFLESLGYSTVAFTTGYLHTELTDADYFLLPASTTFQDLVGQGTVNAFEVLLMRTTAILPLIEFDAAMGEGNSTFLVRLSNKPLEVQAYLILSLFENLEDVYKIEGPKFVFAHIISPHPPYSFLPDGSMNPNAGSPHFFNSSLPPEESIEGYLGQVSFVSWRIEEVIDTILDNSTRPVVIILQADHGPAIQYRMINDKVRNYHERTAILNAIYAPPACQQQLYQGLTPVNTFRILLDCLFGENYDVLPDRHFFSNYSEITDYIKRWDAQRAAEAEESGSPSFSEDSSN
ncbi:MAG: sulfatase-like hydrolase/transferase [Anaerolineales bacterium]